MPWMFSMLRNSMRQSLYSTLYSVPPPPKLFAAAFLKGRASQIVSSRQPLGAKRRRQWQSAVAAATLPKTRAVCGWLQRTRDAPLQGCSQLTKGKRLFVRNMALDLTSSCSRAVGSTSSSG